MASKYGNPRGKAATDAKRKYNSKNYDRIYPYVKKGKKSVYQRAAKASGFDSINDMIESLMDERTAAVLGTVAGAVRGRGSGRGRRGTGKGIKKAAGVAPSLLLSCRSELFVCIAAVFVQRDSAVIFKNRTVGILLPVCTDIVHRTGETNTRAVITKNCNPVVAAVLDDGFNEFFVVFFRNGFKLCFRNADIGVFTDFIARNPFSRPLRSSHSPSRRCACDIQGTAYHARNRRFQPHRQKV